MWHVVENYFSTQTRGDLTELSEDKLTEAYNCLHVDNFHKITAIIYTLYGQYD